MKTSVKNELSQKTRASGLTNKPLRKGTFLPLLGFLKTFLNISPDVLIS